MIIEGRRAIGVLNPLLWTSNKLPLVKRLLYNSIVENILYSSGTWTPGSPEKRKFVGNRDGFCGGQLENPVKNSVIRKTMEAKKDILQRFTENRLERLGHVFIFRRAGF